MRFLKGRRALKIPTLKKANDLIGDDIAKMSIFSAYSLDMAILYGGVDGQKFEVAKPTLKARHSKKYFKKGKGVVAYTLLVNHIPLQTELIGAHMHESYFAFDIWYNRRNPLLVYYESRFVEDVATRETCTDD